MDDDENFSEKISIDDLYTRKNELEENKLKVFAKYYIVFIQRLR